MSQNLFWSKKNFDQKFLKSEQILRYVMFTPSLYPCLDYAKAEELDKLAENDQRAFVERIILLIQI